MSALLLVLGLVGGCWWMNRMERARLKDRSRDAAELARARRAKVKRE